MVRAISIKNCLTLANTGVDYNVGIAIYRGACLIAGLPAQLVSKWAGPDRVIPIQLTLWGLVTASQFVLSGMGSFLATRFLLGILQGGFIPNVSVR